MPAPLKTVRDAAEAWLKRCKREGLDRQTIKTYRSQGEKHILPRIGDRELADLRRADIREFVDEMLDDENSREMTRKVSPPSRGRGSKPKRRTGETPGRESPPSRGRGSKPAPPCRQQRRSRRPLRGGVDRNLPRIGCLTKRLVAPFAGAWIETS